MINGIRMGTNLRFNYGAMHAEEFGKVVELVENAIHVVYGQRLIDSNYLVVELASGMKTTVDVEKIRLPGETSVNGSAIGVYIDDECESLDAFLQSKGRQAVHPIHRSPPRKLSVNR